MSDLFSASGLDKSGSLGSLIFWGPPGTGRTTVARLLAGLVDLGFEQISVVFLRVADLKMVFEAARGRRLGGRGTLLLVDEIHRLSLLREKSNSWLFYRMLEKAMHRKAVLDEFVAAFEHSRENRMSGCL